MARFIQQKVDYMFEAASWSEHEEYKFMSLLADAYRAKEMVDVVLEEPLLGKITEQLTLYFDGRIFTKKMVLQKFHVLRRRFIMINKIRCTKGVSRSTEHIDVLLADESTWDAITKGNSHARLYREKGEPKWHLMEYVFGGIEWDKFYAEAEVSFKNDVQINP